MPHTIVVMDTNILINFIHVQRLSLLGELVDYQFVVPVDVIEEVTEPGQKQQLETAMQQEIFATIVIEDPAELAVYAELRAFMGQGESACLALAESRGWLIASDERRRFRREVLARLGDNRLFTTPGLLLLMIQRNVLAIHEADEIKAFLEQHNFRMRFSSFQELLRPD